LKDDDKGQLRLPVRPSETVNYETETRLAKSM